MPASSRYPGAPRWVKVSGILVVALALAFAVAHLAGGGLGRHMRHGADEPSVGSGGGPAPLGGH
jgi:hypothetical protein